MAGVFPPLLKGIVVCDDVIGNPDSGKPMVVNVWNATRLPAGESVPYTLKKLCVFACFRGGRGRSTFRLEVVHAESRQRVGRVGTFELDFANPNVTLYGRFMLEDVAFPALGAYTVELFCEGQFIEDQLIQLLPPKE